MRTEHDSLGEKDVPDEVYWGVHTARALENFPISGRTIGEYPDLIDRAAEDVEGGALADQFVVDVMQGGAGTSTNMNVNEVITNRALELAGRPRGEYSFLHPLDHVNRGQSTNDTYPTAMKLALGVGLRRLLDEQARLKEALHTGRGIADLVVEHGLMTRDDVETLLQPARLSGEDTSTPVLSVDEGTIGLA